MTWRSVAHYRVLLLGCFLTVGLGVALMTVSLDGLFAAGGDVREAGPTATVRDAAGTVVRAGRDTPDPGGLISVLAMSTAISAMLTVAVTATTLGLGVSLRRRDLALLRLAGASRWRVRRLLLGEAVLVALPAAALGAVIGVLASPRLLEVVSATALAETPIESSGAWPAAVVAAALGVLTALLAAWSASGGLVSLEPADALREEQTELRVLTRRGAAGSVLLLVAGVVMVVAAASADGDTAVPLAVFGTVSLAAGLGTAGPVLLVFPLRLVGGVVRGAVRWPPIELATRAVGASRRRSASLMTPVMGLVAVIGIFGCVLSTVAASATEDARERATDAPVVARADGRPLREGDLAKLRDLEGVRAVVAARSLPALVAAGPDVTREEIQVVDPEALSRVRRLPLRAGTRVLRSSRDVLISTELSDWYGLRPGDRFDVGVFGGPTTRVSIAGVVGTGPAATPVLASPELPGAELATGPLEASLDAPAPAARGLPAGLIAPAVGRAAPDGEAMAAANDQALRILAVPGALFTLVAAASLAVMTVDRRRTELRSIRRLGAPTRSLVVQLGTEAVLIGAVGVALAAGLVALGLAALLGGLSATHLATAVAIPWELLLPLAGGAVLAGALAHVTAGWWALAPLRQPG